MSLSLFSSEPKQAGHRLHSFQVWNWGTFNNKIYTLQPEGNTSLLTGANGSGKTTLIDAVLTLLVPEKRMRFYNQTAGEKGERTENSYVLGAYGKTETDNLQSVKQLRKEKKSVFSILLAVFVNEDRYISLAQVRWFAGSEMKRTFLLAHERLSISNDFTPLDTSGDWKKKLKKKYQGTGNRKRIFFPEGPVEYGQLMRKFFGMRSVKAHTLFSQGIGLKQMADLNAFIRFQMLEERDAETEFQKVRQQLKTLTDAYYKIEKIRHQVELLEPIPIAAAACEQAQAEEISISNRLNIAPYCFARRKKQLLNQALKKLNLEVQVKQQETEKLKILIKEKENERFQLEAQIRQDQTGQQINQLEQEINRLEQKKKEREQRANQFRQWVNEANLEANFQDARSLAETLSHAREKKDVLLGEQQKIEDELKSVYIALQQEKTSKEQLEQELKELQQQKNNITGNPARIRKQLLQHIQIEPEQLPFVGELIRVKSSEQEWERAVEQVLHHFALCLLVPEKYYASVNKYVNSHDLKGRIVYFNVHPSELSDRIPPYDTQLLYHKLELKLSPFRQWIQQQLLKRFDIRCVETIEDLQLAERAMTRKGLIKRGKQHEKDDRPERLKRQHYVLGWENKDKQLAIRELLDDHQRNIDQLQIRIQHSEKSIQTLRSQNNALTRLLECNDFNEIDWQTIAVAIQEKTSELNTLKQSSNKLNILRDQSEQLNIQLNQAGEQLSKQDQALGSIEERIKSYQKLKEEQMQFLEANPLTADSKVKADEFDQHFLQNLSLNELDRKQREVQQEFQKQLNTAKYKANQQEKELEKVMRRAKHPGNDITDRFTDWLDDTHNLSEKAEYYEEYVQLLDRLKNQELIALEERFKHYLNEEMVGKMADFQTWLEQHEEDIEASIEQLNQSLKQITYRSNPSTFLKLVIDKDYRPSIKSFKQLLRDWKPNIAAYELQQNKSILEESYRKIKTILDQLGEDDKYRSEVLDVRNWLTFKAHEIYREEEKKMYCLYQGTSSLSGGESVQLTYAMLMAAIAYQFGINQVGLNPQSFRFICIDEAFSKQDENKGRYLMDLCKQLHVQVMIVSPSRPEEFKLVEPYIKTVHYVYRQDNAESEVFDIPIREFQEQQQQYLQTSEEF